MGTTASGRARAGHRLTLAVLAGLLAPGPLPAQPPRTPPRIVGSVFGEPVTETAFVRHLARFYRNRPLGERLARDIRDRLLVEDAARAGNVTVAPGEIDRAFEALARRVKKETGGKQTLEDVLAGRGTSLREFKSRLGRLVAVRKILRAERKLGPEAEVSNDDVRAWLESRAAAVRLVTDPDRLPPGVMLRIGEHEIDETAFGREILAGLSAADRARELDRLLEERIIDRALEAHHLALTPPDLDAALARERARVAAAPRIGAVPYETILKQMGTTVEQRKRDPDFRATAAIWKIARARFTDKDLEHYYRGHQDRFGPSVRIRHILVRVKRPGHPFSRGVSPEQARKRIEALRRRILGGEAFEKVARRESEDRSRFQGGDLGTIFRRGRMDPALARAAFALEVGQVSEPIRTRFGYHLIQVTEKKPAAPFAAVKARILRARARDWFREAVASARPVNTYRARPRASKSTHDP